MPGVTLHVSAGRTPEIKKNIEDDRSGGEDKEATLDENSADCNTEQAGLKSD
jgi:hypothetical protein